jgi:hypothetical protein
MCWNASERSFSRNEMKEMQWKKVICFGVGYLAIGYLAIGYLAIGFGVGYF